MNPVDSIPAVPPEREKLTKKAITADHPTWCPACGDFAVLASFYKVLEKRQLPPENIVTLAGGGYRLLLSLSVFRQFAWRTFHPWTGSSVGIRHQSGPSRFACFPFRR